MKSTGRPSDERFTLWGGALLIVAGMLLIFDRQAVSFMVGKNHLYMFTYESARIATEAFLAAGFIVTAYGRRHGKHLTGDGFLGPLLLSFFGSSHAATAIISQELADHGSIETFLLTIVQVVALAAGLGAATAVYRAKLAERSTRVLLVVVAVVFAAFTVLALIPSTATHAIATPSYVLFPLSLLALGASLMLDGRDDRPQIRGKLARGRQY